MEHDGGKKPLGGLSPRGLLKRGWNGVTSPLNALKDSVVGAAALRSVAATPTNRMALPSPTEYPSLFDVRGPSSTRSADGATVFSHKHEVEARMPQSARESSSARTGSWGSSGRTGSSSVGWPEEGVGDAQGEEERAYLSVCHHNLHSVLTNPKANNWGGALLDAFYPSLDVDIALAPFPGLADVSTRDFQSYLRQFGTNAAKYEENHVKPVSEQLSSSNVPSISVADEDVTKCLDVVPNLFFRPDFDLTDPNTFDEVMNMPNAASLQEELTTYLDRVEFTLLRQVSSRSDRFFEASADQEVMKQSIKAACDQVATLRKTMDRLRNLLADKTLDIVSLHRRQKRIKELHDLVTMVEEVKSAESAVEALVQCQDYTNALNLIESSQTMLREHLQGIHGLSSLSEKFRGYRGFISTQISQRFISVITSPEWTFQDEEESAYSDKKRHSSLGDEKDTVQQESKRLVDVLFRLDALDDTVKTYLDQLNEEIRVVVKTVVTETIAVSSSSKNSGGSDLGMSSGSESKVSVQLRALTSDEFLQCVQMIFEHLLMILKRAVVVQDILVKSMQKKIDEASEEEKRLKTLAINEANSNGTDNLKTVAGEGWSPSENASDEQKNLGDWKKKTRCAKVIREIDEVVRKTCEFSQRSVSNLFAVRKEVQATYTMPQLRKLYDTTMDFVVSIEKLTGKTDYTLRGALFSQLKLFLEKYHQTQVTKLVSTLDHELWKNTEISETRHKSLDDLSSGRGVALLLSEDREIAGETAPPRKMVSICGKSFRVVWSVLLMLEIVMNYMSCAANFPVLATDVLQRSIEIFRLFNSRTTQLVLGAGAMQIARLKSISARHLALASQSLELSMTLIPHIKAALAAHFTDRQKLLLDEFDRVLRDYAEHNEKIFSKFTSIVEDQIMKRFLENVATEVDYDSASLAVPTNPMRGITQSTLKLHAVLHPVLSPPQMKDVMSRVFDMFTQKLPECFKLVQPRTAAGKERVLNDIEVFVQSFKGVTELTFDGGALLSHFKNAYVS
ncbi:vacuolar protein sorting-associated protein, putative [Phytophthora infestans T30-4]|uniref:Vacuolar protein sorting-associated protein 54 n=1 Tax=Phytophthora infestans (strain T30-4) TaxID=403677 RepID=D0N3E1_PHYIT|nr:vacuolar protein sorting-associated protein, putative [Phytophthora infestans T30-4]EEY69433.1 vacuolar protein sorting-associated protein, putative [Phytophthora infestans T30-4]|eukprot:XP_002999287.1 vacuolar protein sorting-associated protein, putative [Phytophthora infestans T30-4]